MNLKVYCYQPNGYCAVDVNIDNYGVKPYQSKTQFSITTVPASMNILGQLLANWNPKNTCQIEWNAE